MKIWDDRGREEREVYFKYTFQTLTLQKRT